LIPTAGKHTKTDAAAGKVIVDAMFAVGHIVGAFAFLVHWAVLLHRNGQIFSVLSAYQSKRRTYKDTFFSNTGK